MVTIGGTDTSRAAELEATTRGRRLQMQMEAAERRNQETQGYLQQGQQALGQVEENRRREQAMALEAERSGLEYNPATGRYQESPRGAQIRQHEQAKDVAGYSLERDKAVTQALQSQQRLNIEQQEAETRGQMLAKQSAAQAADAEAKWMQEYRLGLKAEADIAADVEAGKLKREDFDFQQRKHIDQSLADLTKMQVDVLKGGKGSGDAFRKLIGDSKDPELQAAVQLLDGGDDLSPEQMERINAFVSEKRNFVALEGAAQTGYLSQFADLSSPTMQRYVQTRAQHSDVLNRTLMQELAVVQQLRAQGKSDAEIAKAMRGAQVYGRAPEDVTRLLNRAAARSFLELEQFRAGYAARQDGGQQQSGAAPAGPGSKLGNQTSPQPGGGAQPGTGGVQFPGSWRKQR